MLTHNDHSHTRGMPCPARAHVVHTLVMHDRGTHIRTARTQCTYAQPTHTPRTLRTRAPQADKVSGDPVLGRYLADTLAVVPRLCAAQLQGLFNDSVQDTLMVSYLANLMRVQVGW